MANITDSRGSIKDWSGWDFVPGIAFLVVGVLALLLPLVASLATGIYLGFMLCVAGGFAVAAGIANFGRRGAWLGLLLGLLSFLAGILVLYNPVVGAVSLIWVLGAWLFVGGIFQLAMGVGAPVGRGWLLLVGIVDVLLGLLIFLMPPASAFAFLGYFVGISFVFRGLWSLFFTADLHRAEDVASG
jgi:uncharacterized membrane protein HdeD (DUF308 family)